MPTVSKRAGSGPSAVGEDPWPTIVALVATMGWCPACRSSRVATASVSPPNWLPGGGIRRMMRSDWDSSSEPWEPYPM
jgi:hypothetical protein